MDEAVSAPRTETKSSGSCEPSKAHNVCVDMSSVFVFGLDTHKLNEHIFATLLFKTT